MSEKSVISITVAIFVLAGCAPEMQEPVRVRPDGGSVADSLSMLIQHSRNAVPLRANGQCCLRYYADGKRHKENFPIKLWMNPPARIYLQGDVAFDAKGITLGSNKEEFWLTMKPKQICSYWWGRWAQQDCLGKLMISPGLILEALGIMNIGDEENWSVSRTGAFDVLTKHEGDAETQKVYVAVDGGMVRKIVYLQANGKAMAVTELDKYKEVAESFYVPYFVKIITPSEEGEPVSVVLNLTSAKPASFTEEQEDNLFQRRKPKGFKHIYELINGEMIEQPQ